ncbi:CsbD family protein [Mycetohabitans sp. B2]|uniref:CsbD family protein n=1 Tax=Mycetohabitans sp. B2 TaxID=2841274 RepID=UPI001F2F0C62|nr:CsbD family protein [Mycetohabitans sp. B2]MCF7695044.1 CsbD family protein [Mycetohabitans sp. B2]
MNKDQIKGVTEQVKGKANEVVGKVTGNKAHEIKGDVQQAAGKTQKTWGDAKEQVKKGS